MRICGKTAPWYVTCGLYSHTVEAGTFPHRSYRPRRWDDGCVLPPKVLLSSPKMDRRARFTPQGAPTGPSCGPMGAFFPSKCSYRSKLWTGGRTCRLCASASPRRISATKKEAPRTGFLFLLCIETGYASLRESRRGPRRSPPRRSPPRRSRRSPPRSELAAADADTPAFGLRSRLP